MEVDLHIHTTASDGTFSPTEVIKKAMELNLKAIAITDHDNVDGLAEANKFAKENNFELINGIEFSCNIDEKEVHILGYFLNLKDKLFLERIDKLLETRNERNKKMIEKLNNNGIIINIENILKESGGKILGRVHFANALIKKGYAVDIDDAFKKYLSKDGLAYVPRINCHPKTVVKYLKENGAFVSLAHPKYISKDDNFVLNLIKELKEYGLNGLEVDYPSYNKEESIKYKSWAKKLNLVRTGGSDFHGDNRKHLMIGANGISYEQLTLLKREINKL